MTFFLQEHELEASAHNFLHQSNSDARSRSPSPVRTKWGSTIRRMAKTEKTQETSEKTHDVAGDKNQGFKEDESKQAVVNESKKPSNSR